MAKWAFAEDELNSDLSDRPKSADQRSHTSPKQTYADASYTYHLHRTKPLSLLLPTLTLTSLKPRSLLSTSFTSLCSSSGFLSLILNTHLFIPLGLDTRGDIVVPLLDRCSLTLLDILLPINPTHQSLLIVAIEVRSRRRTSPCLISILSFPTS